MPRPRKKRCCRIHEGDRVYKPRSIPMPRLESIHLNLDELEAMRHCDLERREQDEAGRRMGVSRGTVQRLLKSGRAKVVGAIVDSKALIIEEGESHEDLRTDSG